MIPGRPLLVAPLLLALLAGCGDGPPRLLVTVGSATPVEVSWLEVTLLRAGREARATFRGDGPFTVGPDAPRRIRLSFDAPGELTLEARGLDAAGAEVARSETAGSRVEAGTVAELAVTLGPSPCRNHARDSDESDVDCGGRCPACSGAPCARPAECASGACDVGRCLSRPRITAITPSHALATGGAAVTLAGEDFQPGLRLTVDGAPVADLKVPSSTGATCKLPSRPGAFGPVPVVLVNPDGQRFASDDLFAFHAGTVEFLVAPAYPAGPLPNGLAVGDLDGNGTPDLAAANSNRNRVSLLLAAGGGAFRAPVDLATAEQPRAVAVTDLNGDALRDLAVGCDFAGGVSVLLAKGGGAFQPHVFVPTGAHVRAIAAGDLNRDGKPDLVTADWGAATLTVLLGRGGVAFDPPLKVAVGQLPLAVVIEDLSRDGKLDLASADNLGGVSVALGNGDGTFQKATPYATADAPRGLAAGDFDGDGRPDLLVAAEEGGAVSLLRGAMAPPGTFLAAVTYPLGTAPVAVVSGDFDGDGKLDAATADPAANGVSLLRGDGKGGFAITRWATGQTPLGLAASDLDGDGRLDLATANYGSDDVSVVLADPGSPGALRAAGSHPVGRTPVFLAPADLDGDGRLDLAVSAYNSDQVAVLLSGSGGRFLPAARYDVAKKPRAIAIGDLSGDGRPDLVVAHDGAPPTMSVLLANARGFDPPVMYAAGGTSTALAVARVDGDELPDVVYVTPGHTLGVLLGTGGGKLAPARTTDLLSTLSAVAARDFNGDGKVDLAVCDDSKSVVAVLPGRGDGTFGAPVLHQVEQGPHAIAVADLDGDGRADLATANLDTTSVSVLLGNGDGTFRVLPGVSVGPGRVPKMILAGDFDGDGHADLAVQNDLTDTGLFLGRGDGTLRAPLSVRGGFPIAAGDFDGDRRLDLALAAETVLLLRNVSR